MLAKALAPLAKAIAVSRPTNWAAFFLLFCLGVVGSGQPLTAVAFFFAFLWTVPYWLWCCSINDLMDFETDTINEFKGIWDGGRVAQEDTRLLRTLPYVSFVVIAIPTFLTFNLSLWLVTAVALLLGYVYSAPPVRLKSRAPFDSMSNGVFIGLVYVAGLQLAGLYLPSVANLAFAAGVFLSVTAIHMVGALRDYSADRQADIATIAVRYGQKTTAGIAAILYGATGVVMARHFPAFGVAGAIGAAVCLWLWARPDEAASARAANILLIVFTVTGLFTMQWMRDA